MGSDIPVSFNFWHRSHDAVHIFTWSNQHLLMATMSLAQQSYRGHFSLYTFLGNVVIRQCIGSRHHMRYILEKGGRIVRRPCRSQSLRQGDCFTKVLDSKGDGAVIGSTVGSNVPALAVVADISMQSTNLFNSLCWFLGIAVSPF
jgi:hypothetical protein